MVVWFVVLQMRMRMPLFELQTCVLIRSFLKFYSMSANSNGLARQHLCIRLPKPMLVSYLICPLSHVQAQMMCVVLELLSFRIIFFSVTASVLKTVRSYFILTSPVFTVVTKTKLFACSDRNCKERNDMFVSLCSCADLSGNLLFIRQFFNGH